MALSKKLKEEAKALGIPNYWSYGEKKLKELIKAKQPKNKPAPKNAPAKSKPAIKTPVKPAVKKELASPKSAPPPKNNKAEILKHVTAINGLIATERKLLQGTKAQYHGAMLDRVLVSLKDITMYMGKIR